MDNLPVLENPRETIATHQEHIKELSNLEIANFSDKTNTDLKLEYGAPNLDYLTQLDQNYSDLLKTLYEWGNDLYSENLVTEATSVLEYGISLKTDIIKHYTLLAEIYKSENAIRKIETLLTFADSLNCLTASAIKRSLNEILQSCRSPE